MVMKSVGNDDLPSGGYAMHSYAYVVPKEYANWSIEAMCEYTGNVGRGRIV